MAAVGGNNVYVDIIFRLQAEAAKRAERIIANLVKRGELATLTLQKLKLPKEFEKSAVDATSAIHKLAQKADTASRASSRLWQGAIGDLPIKFRQLAASTKAEADELESYIDLQWEAIKVDKAKLQKVKELGATESNYKEVLAKKSNELRQHAALYSRFANDLERGGKAMLAELARQRELYKIYRMTGVRVQGLRMELVHLAQVLDSIVPKSERTWKPAARDIKALAGGLNAFNQASAKTLMTLTRNAAAARAAGQPVAVLDDYASRLLHTLSPLNYQLANMGITFPITAKTSEKLAKGMDRGTKAAARQAQALAETAAATDRLALPAERAAALGSRLYDVFTGNSRVVLKLDGSIRKATGVLDYFDEGLHRVNRALRAQNANFVITQETLERVNREGWGAFTEAQRKALEGIKASYEENQKWHRSLNQNQRALLNVINRVEELDRALHFEIQTADDVKFLLNRLRREGYEKLTDAEKRAIEQLESGIKETWRWDATTKRLAQNVISLKNSYVQQHDILARLTPRQRLFYGTIYRLQMGMRRLSHFIDRVSIGSLKLLGPIFLATAAFNTFSRIIGECVSSFTEYEDRLIDLRVAGEMSLSSVNRLSEAFISIERILPVSATQLAQIATLAAKAGVTGTEQIKAFTLAIAKFTKVTGWSADQASDALLKISRAFSLPIENSEKLASMMHHLAVVSVADAKDIVNAMTRVGASATNLGIAADEAAAMATTLIDAGMRAERAGTRLRAFFREFLEKSDKIAKVMEEGAGVKDFAKLMEERPAEALRLFLEYLHNIPDEVERSRIVYSIFGSVASFAILTLVEHYPELTKRMQEANRELMYGTRLTEDFSVWMDAASTSIAKAENSINRLQRTIGAGLAPVVSGLADAFSDFLENLLGINTDIKLTTKGTQEWIEVFGKGYPMIERFNKSLALASFWREKLSWIPSRAIAKNINEINNEWQEYVENVATGGDIVFGYAGRVLDILDKVGGRTETINSLEEEHRQITETLNKAYKIRNHLESKYRRETLINIKQKIDNKIKLTEQEEKLRDAVEQHADAERYIAWAVAYREFLERRLVDTIANAAEAAREKRELEDQDIAALNDYLRLYEYFDKAQKSVNYDTAIGVALLTKYGPLYADLKKNIDPKKLEAWANELETAAREGKPLAPIIGKIVYEINDMGYALYLGADGWRIWNREASGIIPTSEEIAKAFDEIKKSAQDLNKASPEEFLDSLDEGWHSIERFMDATASATRAKIELDKALRYTPAGIMFEAEYSEQIERINKLMEEYQNAADATVAAEKAQALMAEILALQQAVLNDIQSESSLVLQEQKLAWLDIIDTMYEWIEGITSEVPLAAKSLEEWETKYAEIAETSDTAFKQLEDAIEAVTEKIGALRPATESASEAAENAVPSMNTFGTALGTAAWSASVMNDELGNLPENIESARNTADKNPINITTSSNIGDTLSEISKSIEEFVPSAITIPVTLSFLSPPAIDLVWKALISFIGGKIEELTGLISLSFELLQPKKSEEIGVGQYGGEIQRTGLYLLHGREYVLPKRDLQRLIDALYLMTRRERAEEFTAQKIYNIRIEGEPTPGAARFIRELEYIG